MVPESASVAAKPAAQPARDVPETVIQPPSGWQAVQWAEVWAHRHLIYFLTWRDLIVRYKQTVLGALWAVIQPALLMVVFGVVFQGNASKTTDGLPYPIFLYAGLLPWTFISQATSKAAMSLVASERLIEKVYFPRLVIPISAVAGALVDFAIAAAVLGAMMVYYKIPPTLMIVLLPVAVLLLCLVSLGFGILYASLNVRYRDFRHMLGFVIQIWMFMTPTIYNPAFYDEIAAQQQASSPAAPVANTVANSAEAAKPQGTAEASAQQSAPAAKASLWSRARRLIARNVSLREWNPLTAMISFFRATIVGGPIPWYSLIKATITTTVILSVGVIYFRRVEGGFADII